MSIETRLPLKDLYDALEWAYGCLEIVKSDRKPIDLEDCLEAVKLARDVVGDALDSAPATHEMHTANRACVDDAKPHKRGGGMTHHEGERPCPTCGGAGVFKPDADEPLSRPDLPCPDCKPDST